MCFAKKICLCAFALVIFSTHATSDEIDAISTAFFRDLFSRVYTDFYIDSDGDPRGSLETIQPLRQVGPHTLFMQSRAAFEDDSWTFNSGLGYRYLMPNQQWLLGANAWFDSTSRYKHKRWGAGLEAIGEYLTFRTNYYNGVTDWKRVSTSAMSYVEERALDGFDAEMEGPIPHMPWLRIGASYYFWDLYTAGADDTSGFQGRLQADLASDLRLETGYKADNYNDVGFVKLSWFLGAQREIEHSAMETGWISENRFQPRDLKRQTLARVKRQHEVVVERRTVTNSVTFSGISVARGS